MNPVDESFLKHEDMETFHKRLETVEEYHRNLHATIQDIVNEMLSSKQLPENNKTFNDEEVQQEEQQKEWFQKAIEEYHHTTLKNAIHYLVEEQVALKFKQRKEKDSKIDKQLQQVPHDDDDDDDDGVSYCFEHVDIDNHGGVQAIRGEDQHDINNVGIEEKLSEDSYSLMILSKPFSTRHWWYGFSVWVLQITLLVMITSGQSSSDNANTPLFDVPINNTTEVRIAQFLAIIVALLMTSDLISSLRCITLLLMNDYSTNHHEKNMALIFKNSTGNITAQEEEKDGIRQLHYSTNIELKSIYRWMVIIPNTLKLLQGSLALFTSFIIIIQSSDIIDLFKEFLALQVISNIDNICFSLCVGGFFGRSFQQQAAKARKIVFKEVIETGPVHLRKKIAPHTCAAFVVFLIMIGGWMLNVRKQLDGSIYDVKYPQCQVKSQQGEIFKIGDGRCDGGLYNRYECGFDGGDCVEFQLAYPTCNFTSVKPWMIADGNCDEFNNYEECGYDGGDCCPFDEKFHNGVCDAIPELNSERCKFDNNECIEHNKNYPGCFVNDVSKLGNGFCDGGPYMSQDCKFDGQDCAKCFSMVEDPSSVGNGVCDPSNNIPECNWDSGDCDSCQSLDSALDISLIGNEECDFGIYILPDCNFDGGDCLSNKWRIFSDTRDLVKPDIWDISSLEFYEDENCATSKLEGDPISSGHYPSSVYSPASAFDNNPASTWGGRPGYIFGPLWIGMELEKKVMVRCVRYTDYGPHGSNQISVQASYEEEWRNIRESEVVPNEENTVQTLPRYAKYPGCIVNDVKKLGDGNCDYGNYFTESCRYDDGDCVKCLDSIEDISRIADGICDGGNYFFSCEGDGGDCRECSKLGVNMSKVGDGYCDQDIVKFGNLCGFDGNDCVAFWEKQNWTHVRHIPRGEKWYEGNDNLKGVARSKPSKSKGEDKSWSLNFEDAVPGFNQYLFSSGDNARWLITTKDAVQNNDIPYENEPRIVIKSSLNENCHKVRWYNRDYTAEDPWISLTDHNDAADGDFLYAENGYSLHDYNNRHRESLKDGLDVYIRYKAVYTCAD